MFRPPRSASRSNSSSLALNHSSFRNAKAKRRATLRSTVSLYHQAEAPSWPRRERRDVHGVDDSDVGTDQRCILLSRRCGRIAAALGPLAAQIDHVGSTAVPGLAAKPIVDIDLCVPRRRRRAELPSGAPARWIRTRSPGAGPSRPLLARRRGACARLRGGSDDVGPHLLFRDWLRQSAGHRAPYMRRPSADITMMRSGRPRPG